ncbi:hypothetical protein ABTM83_19455, partial [Acinetobacter baumannii]
KPARPRTPRAAKTAPGVAAAETAATPAVIAPEVTAAEDEATFALRSLQQAHANNRQYEATDAELLRFYEQMVLIRRFEERAGQLYGLGLI